MELDLKLILTHILGFAITVWILARFAWKPILRILQDRREKIKSEFDHIEAGKAALAKTVEGYEAKLKEIDNLARQKLAEAVNEGHKMAAEIREQGRHEAREIINRAKAELERDVQKARAALKEDMIRMTIAAAEKIISTKLDDTDHRRLVAGFLDRVEKA